MSYDSIPARACSGAHPDPGGSSAYRILFKTPSPDEAERLRALLAREYIPCDLTRVEGEAAFQGALSAAFCYDLFILDYNGEAGMKDLAAALHGGPLVPVLVVCRAEEEEAALASLRAGAFDCVRLDLPLRIASAVRRALENTHHAALRAEAEASRIRLGSLARALLESTAEGILVADLAGRILAYNRKFMGLCGLPEFVLAPMDLARTAQALMEQFEDPSAFLDEVRRLIGRPEGEAHGILKAGDDRVLEGSLLAYPEGERPEGLVLKFRDVTGREKAAARLARQAEAQRAFLDDAAAAGVILWHAQGGALTLSAGAASLLELDPALVPSTVEGFAELVHPEDRDRFRQAMAGRSGPLLILRLQGPGGTWIPTRWTLGAPSAGGCRGAFRSLALDVAPEKLHVADLRRRWTATLAASLVRAFRAPVQALARNLEALRAGGAEAPAPLEALAGGVKDLRGLLDAIACLGGPAPADGLLLDLNAAASGMRAWSKAVLGPSIAIHWDLQPGLPLLPLDPGSLEPLLASLLQNAAQAMDGRGIIRVSTGQVGSEENARIFLEVRDHGPGIPPRIQERMFDPFFTTRKGARGLGLTVAACVAESLGGAIDVESAPMQGAAFRLWLPAFPGPRRS